MHREVLSLSKGQIFKNPSATKNSTLKTQNGHRHIGDGLVCDHINGNGLDNRKANLRPATISQDLCNRPKRKANTRSKYKGLEWDKASRKWKARIQFEGRKFYLGSFDSETAAANSQSPFDNRRRRKMPFITIQGFT